MKFEFKFADLQAFWLMDGHGPYVWGAYAVTFAAMIGLIWITRTERKNLIKQQASILRRSEGAQP